MTVSEQLEEMNKGDRFRRWFMWVLIALALIVPVEAVFLAMNISRTAGVADQVDRELANARRSICLSRATTLRTAPQTVKEQRALNDALTPTSRKVCPGLDYESLAKARAAEQLLIDRGIDPKTIVAGDPASAAASDKATK